MGALSAAITISNTTCPSMQFGLLGHLFGRLLTIPIYSRDCQPGVQEPDLLARCQCQMCQFLTSIIPPL